MRLSILFLGFVIALLSTSCNSVYKKHYGNGYTFLPQKKKAPVEAAAKNKNIQQKALEEISLDIKKEKQKEQKKAEQSYHTYHKSLDKVENNAPARFLSSINKFTTKKIEALKRDTIYRKEPAKPGSMSEAVKDKSQNALIFAIVSIVTFWFLWLLSLIPAIIALSMAKKAIAMAKLSGDTVPSDANTAKIIAWVTIGLNLLSIVVIVLYILLLLLLIASI